MKLYCLLFLFVGSLRVQAQEIISSSTSIESCLDQQDCLTVSNVSYLFYDETRSEFYLKVDFSNFRDEQDTMHNWLDDVIDTTLFFKAILPKESFPALSNQNTKTFMLNGEIFYNNIWLPESIEMNIFNTENSIVISGNNNLKYDSYKVSFSLSLVPKDFKAYRKLYYENQTVTINVNLGRINLMRPGMEFHLKEVYFQSTR